MMTLDGPAPVDRLCPPLGAVGFRARLESELADSTLVYARLFRAHNGPIRSVLIEVERIITDAIGADIANRSELVLAELLNNVAQHGWLPASEDGYAPMPLGAAVVELRISVRGDDLVCVVADSGSEIPHHSIFNSVTPVPETLAESGFGWPLIRGPSAELRYMRVGRRNMLVFSMPVG